MVKIENQSHLPKGITPEQNQKLADTVAFYLEKADSFYPYFKHLRQFFQIRVVWRPELSVRVAGICMQRIGVLGYNPIYVNEPDFWNTTVPHELAHLVQHYVFPLAKQAHGPEFRSIMREFGCSERTYHTMRPEPLIEKRPFQYSCPKCGEIYFLSNLLHNRYQAGKRRACAKPECKKKYSSFYDRVIVPVTKVQIPIDNLDKISQTA